MSSVSRPGKRETGKNIFHEGGQSYEGAELDAIGRRRFPNLDRSDMTHPANAGLLRHAPPQSAAGKPQRRQAAPLARDCLLRFDDRL